MDRTMPSPRPRPPRLEMEDAEFVQCMHELDETVASLGDTSSYQSFGRIRGFAEDGSIGTNNTLTTDFGHTVLTRQRVEIGGIEKVTEGPRRRRHRGTKSLASHRSSHTHRSKGSLSLEQLISDTILKTASPDQFDEESYSPRSRSSSTEDILRDLKQADAVLASEGKSLRGNLLPPLAHDDEPDLLPPTIEWQNPPGDDWFDPTQWADWADWPSPNNQSYCTLETPLQCEKNSEESGEKTWYTFETETETSMFSDPFWTDFNNNPFEKKKQLDTVDAVEPTNFAPWSS